VASVVGFFQLKGSLSRHVNASDIRENWRFGRWLAGSEVMQFCSSLHMQVWWAALILGVAASADLRVAMIMFGPARVISFFLSTVLPTRFAKTLQAGGADALHAKVKTVYLGLIPTVGLYCLLLVVFPKQVLWLIYGDQYVAGAAVTVLMLYSVSAFLSYLQMVVSAALTASRQTHLIFVGSLCGCAVALAASPVLIKVFGANGAILSMITTTLVVSVLYVVAYYRKLRSGEPRGFEVVSGTAEVSA
jgi:O-antigen/teichoic acid export membrane protein